MTRLCRRFIVDGQVQGVGYRAATRAAARRLGLTGWVRNCEDGRVELLACGLAADLAELEQWLWQGPGPAEVASVTREEHTPEAHSDFAIRF